jgi:DNA-binding response OmpR family regulator
MRALKEAAPTRDIPIVMVSAHALPLLGADQRSADFVLSKPFDLAELIAAVHVFLTRSPQLSANAVTATYPRSEDVDPSVGANGSNAAGHFRQ